MAWEEATVLGLIGIIGFIFWQVNLCPFDNKIVQRLYAYFVSWMGIIFLLLTTRIILKESDTLAAGVDTANLLDTWFLILISLFTFALIYLLYEVVRKKLKEKKPVQFVDEEIPAVRIQG